MNSVKINNEIGLNYPDGFSEMSAEELTRHFGSAEQRWGIFNPQKHSVISVGWAKAGVKYSMTDAESYLLDMTARMRRSLINYQQISEYQMIIAKKKAYGVRFEYRVNDSVRVHVSDLIVFKNKKNFYAIQFAARKPSADDDRADLLEVIKSITVG